MKCSRCGAEIPDGSRFCDSCGAAQNTAAQSAQTTQTNSGAAKPKKTNWFVTILIVAVVYFAARYAGQLFGASMAGNSAKNGSTTTQQSQSAGKSSGSSTGTQSALPAFPDLISTRKVLKNDEGGGLTSYVAVYQGNDTGMITKIIYVYRLGANSGYDRSSVDNADFRNQFPSFSQFSYYEENGETVCVVRFDDMKDKSHMKAMVDIGELIPEEGTDISKIDGIDAEPYIQSYYDLGYTDCPYEDMPSLHLD